jgi:hypothetical protein
MPQAGWARLWKHALVCQILLSSLVCSISPAPQATGDKDSALQLNVTTARGQTTGSGYAFAESCQADLWSWSTASSSYGREHGHRSTSYYTSSMTGTSIIPGSTKVTSLVTLCDGHARVVGQVSYGSSESSRYETTWTNTNPTFVFASYPTPKPCSISPGDCKLLYSSWTSRYNTMTKNDHSEGLLDPPCTTPVSSLSYSTENGHVCDNCQLIGSKIRLLYWPVITKAGSGNLCNKTAETISATPTGDGPNTFATLGITLTSPTVAVSIGGLSRVDQCGTTVANTIIPVLPQDVSSVEGARALFTHMPFNFANLNYKCLSDLDTIYFATSNRTDCYQEVPASAYFYGEANAAGEEWWSPKIFANSTIWPNYQPQVLPPNTLTAAIRSIWGSSCNIHPDGVWDPPIALGTQKSIPLPTAPDSPAEYATPTSNPAMPALPSYAQPAITPATNDGTSTRCDTSKSAPSPMTPSKPMGTVHVIHTTIFTLPTKNGVQTLIAMYGSDGVSLGNARTTISLMTDGSGPQASYDPEIHPSIDAQVVTFDDTVYTVSANEVGGLKFIGQSTTVTIKQNDSHTTTSVGRLALATGSSTQSDNPRQHSSKDSDEPSTSSSGVRKAFMTCVHLSLLAVLVTLFL